MEYSEICNIATSRVFIPISIGNHYYSNKRLQRLFQEIIEPCALSTVFICDQLRYLSYLIRGERNHSQIASKVALQLAQMLATLKNCGIVCTPNHDIWSWKDISSDNRLEKIAYDIQELINTDNDVADQARYYCEYFLCRFGQPEFEPKELVALQMQYLISDTSLSIYMNECIGYDFEIYQRGLGFIDFLYDMKTEDVIRISGGSARRKLVSLELLWGERK